MLGMATYSLATDTMLDVPGATKTPSQVKWDLLKNLRETEVAAQSNRETLSDLQKKIDPILHANKDLAIIASVEKEFAEMSERWSQIEDDSKAYQAWKLEHTTFLEAARVQRSHVSDLQAAIWDMRDSLQSSITELDMQLRDFDILHQEIKRLPNTYEELGPYKQKVRAARSRYNDQARHGQNLFKDFRGRISPIEDTIKDGRATIVLQQSKARAIFQQAKQALEAKRRAAEEEKQAAEAEKRKAEQEAARQREEEEDKRRMAERAQQRAEEERRMAAERSARHDKHISFLETHQAKDLSDYRLAFAFWSNPFAYQGKNVFLVGGCHKHIGPNQAIVAIVPDRNPEQYIVQWDTSRNLAEIAVNGKPYVRCVVKVLGTIHVQHACSTERYRM
jgi:hypothetical protein